MAQSHHHPSLRRRRKSATLTVSKKDKSGEDVRHTIKKSMHDIKLAFSEFYLSVVLLQNYQTLNFTGFRKILKKHDKVCKFKFCMTYSQQSCRIFEGITFQIWMLNDQESILPGVVIIFSHK